MEVSALVGQAQLGSGSPAAGQKPDLTPDPLAQHTVPGELGKDPSYRTVPTSGFPEVAESLAAGEAPLPEVKHQGSPPLINSYNRRVKRRLGRELEKPVFPGCGHPQLPLGPVGAQDTHQRLGDQGDPPLSNPSPRQGHRFDRAGPMRQQGDGGHARYRKGALPEVSRSSKP